MTAPARRRPPGRRLSETRRMAHIRADGGTTHFLVTVGYAAEAPLRPVEVFYSEGFRSGADLEFLCQDACVLISILLQHGMAPMEIARSLSTREAPDGGSAPGSLAGTIAAGLDEPPAWADELARRAAE